MEPSPRAADQLRAIDLLGSGLTALGVEHWFFGGWAVDLHLGRLSREHDDVDVAVWRADLGRVVALLGAEGWTGAGGAADEGWTAYERGGVRLEVTVLARDAEGVVHTPLPVGRGDWPDGSFGEESGEVRGVRARVVGRSSLVQDKSGPRDDEAAALKDRADVRLLQASRPGGRQ